MYRLIFLLLGLLLWPACNTAEPEVEEEPGVPPPLVDPFVMNDRIGRAINFGNALEAPSEGAWGVRLESIQFQRAKEAGFDTIRLPIRWSAHAQLGEPYTITTSFFERVDWAIEQALAQDLNIIINIHHYEEMATAPESQKKRWLGLWEQIANRYKYQPENVLFELLNEPHNELTDGLWNGFLLEAIAVIRETNPTRNLIVGPVFWNNPGWLPQLNLPNDSNIIVTVHFYSPFEFTHQGAEWVDGANAWLGTTWDGTDDEMAAISNVFTDVANWGAQNNRPLFVGEFGAYSRADMDSRVRWTNFVARECERLGMSWSYWEFMSGFGIYSTTSDTFNMELLEALIPPEG